MGIDFLDLDFRLEKQFGVKLRPEDFNPNLRKPWDMTAGELLDLVARRSPQVRPKCLSCGRSWSASTEQCPNCGKPVCRDQWEILRAILDSVSGVDQEKITRETFLIKDLGMT